MKIIPTFFLLLFSEIFFAQQNFQKAQFGFTIRATINILPIVSKKTLLRSDSEPRYNCRISANAGVANRWISDNIYPSFNVELSLYNGGFGSAERPDYVENDIKYSDGGKVRFPFQMDAVLAFTLTSGFLNKNASDNSMLRYFSDFATPSLRNPYSSSLSFGTNLIMTTDSRREFQRVGFINVNVKKTQLSYYNDGGSGIKNLFLGDQEDRYYTGGGTLSHDFVGNHDPIILEFSMHKFTGFTQAAFEISNETESKTVRYNDMSQYSYNKSLIRLNFQNLSVKNPGLGISLSSFNIKPADVQFLIHRITSDSYHIILDEPYFFLEPIIIYHFNK